MNKAKVNELVPLAYEALQETGIVKDGKIDKAFRGQISSFGVAVTMGSFLSAIAFFSEEESAAKVDRTLLMKAILVVLKKSGKASNVNELYQYIFKAKKVSEAKLKEDVINATIAIKLAMNLYILEDAGKNKDN